MANSTAIQRKLVLKMSVSLDGFVARPNGEVDCISDIGGRRFHGVGSQYASQSRRVRKTQDSGQACDSCNSELRDRFDPESLEGVSRIARIASGLTPVA